MDQPWVTALVDAELNLPLESRPGPFAISFHQSGVLAGLYRPLVPDAQTAHDLPELYVVARGSAVIRRANERRPVSQGDLIFIDRDIDHGFEDITADFVTWAIFWSPTPA